MGLNAHALFLERNLIMLQYFFIVLFEGEEVGRVAVDESYLSEYIETVETFNNSITKSPLATLDITCTTRGY